jgi:putative ABC transport system substrate-binding protein
VIGGFVVVSLVTVLFVTHADSAFWIQAGGLVSDSSEQKASALQAARLVVRILSGARPQALPVEGANKIELAINLKTEKALGLTIPQSIGVRAGHVVQ